MSVRIRNALKDLRAGQFSPFSPDFQNLVTAGWATECGVITADGEYAAEVFFGPLAQVGADHDSQ